MERNKSDVVRGVVIGVIVGVVIALGIAIKGNAITGLVTGGILGLITGVVPASAGRRIITFIQEAIVELKRVAWPTKEESWTHTRVVLLVMAVCALYLGLLDAALTWLMAKINVAA